MDIGLISEYFPKSGGDEARGGVEYRAYYIACMLARNHEVTVYTVKEGGSPPRDSFDGFNVEYVEPEIGYSHSGNLLERFNFMRNAGKNMASAGHDLVDAYSFMSYPAGWRSGADARIATYHDVWAGRWMKIMGLKGALGELLERYVLSRDWSHIIAVSDYTRRNLLAHGVDEEKVSVVHNGVSLKELGQVKAEKTLNPSICVISRLVGYKRVGDVLEAAKKLEAYPSLKVDVVGTGPLLGRLKAKAKSLGIHERVTFHGYVKERVRMLELLASSHCFILPSVVEGFGMTVVEAMGLGVPYAASDIPPVREATGGGVGGLLYPPGDIDSLSQAVERILAGGVKPDKSFVIENYDWKKLAKSVAEIYEKTTD